jgi:hypothetical protein
VLCVAANALTRLGHAYTVTDFADLRRPTKKQPLVGTHKLLQDTFLEGEEAKGNSFANMQSKQLVQLGTSFVPAPCSRATKACVGVHRVGIGKKLLY